MTENYNSGSKFHDSARCPGPLFPAAAAVNGYINNLLDYGSAL